MSNHELLEAILASPWERDQDPEVEVLVTFHADDVDDAFCAIIDADTERMSSLDALILAALAEVTP
jgi:hypothetical protein